MSLGQRAEFYNFVYCRGSGAHVNNPFSTVVNGGGTETHPRNLEVIEKSNGKLYHKTITGSDQELITQGTTGVTLGSAGSGAEFSREPSTAQNDIFLHTTISGSRYYLKATSGGNLSLVTEAAKNTAVANKETDIQTFNTLQFDIVAVNKNDVNGN